VRITNNNHNKENFNLHTNSSSPLGRKRINTQNIIILLSSTLVKK
jgi:hypothetical protein